jgi:hypothetical protein
MPLAVPLSWARSLDRDTGCRKARASWLTGQAEVVDNVSISLPLHFIEPDIVCIRALPPFFTLKLQRFLKLVDRIQELS